MNPTVMTFFHLLLGQMFFIFLLFFMSKYGSGPQLDVYHRFRWLTILHKNQMETHVLCLLHIEKVLERQAILKRCKKGKTYRQGIKKINFFWVLFAKFFSIFWAPFKNIMQSKIDKVSSFYYLSRLSEFFDVITVMPTTFLLIFYHYQ